LIDKDVGFEPGIHLGSIEPFLHFHGHFGGCKRIHLSRYLSCRKQRILRFQPQ
jgi:hypothetical protein